jgi:hypothetical protein
MIHERGILTKWMRVLKRNSGLHLANDCIPREGFTHLGFENE